MDPALWKINDRNASELACDLSLRLVNQQADTFAFNADGEPFDSAALYAYGDAISLYKGAVRWFHGVVVSGPRFGSPVEERHDYAAEGPWWYLERVSFQQAWRSGTLGGTLNKSHVILGRDIDNNIVAVGEVVKEVLDHAIGLGAPIAYVQAELDALAAKPPTDEPVDITHGEAIRRMLRWMPDVSTWFDYAAETPVLHFTRRASAVAVQHACTGAPAERIDIVERSDLVRSGVVIAYERIDEIDGERIPILQTDAYPPGTAVDLDTLCLTINVNGMQLATHSIEVEVRYLANTWEKDFWTDAVPALRDKQNLFVDLATEPIDFYNKVLVSGPLPEWTNKKVVPVEFTGELSWTEPNGTEVKRAKHSVTLDTTNAETRKYTREIAYTPPDPFPTGLAQAMHEALSVVHWQGSFVLSEEECSGGVSPGSVLNLSGGLAAWSTMRAVVQQVAFDIDAGSTTIGFGPPEHLGPQDIVALLNANRRRITHYSADTRATGLATGGQEVDTGGKTPNTLTSATARYSKIIIDDGENNPAKKIVLDSSMLKEGCILVCTSDGLMEIAEDVWQAGS